MLKVMVFIDGSWLSRCRGDLSKKIADSKLIIDFGKLAHVINNQVNTELATTTAELIRTYFFASLPVNVDPKDAQLVEDQRNFYNTLRRDFYYEVEIFPLDLKGRRYHSYDRDSDDYFVPKEKCVDIALATSMLHLATLPYAYDVAIPIIGDRDYVPVLQKVRQLGKRIMIISVHQNCADAYDPLKDPTDSLGVRDFPTLYLDSDNILPHILRGPSRRKVKCESFLHEGDSCIWTAEQVEHGVPYYCPRCRRAYNHRRPSRAPEGLIPVASIIEHAA